MTQQNDPLDILIIGGGINGAGIARDAAGRGLKVMLVEQGDLASATSSASSKLIHGGLRYLETYQFRLVREALAEREILLRLAPHIIWPLTFVLPHDKTLRQRWMIRAGLFLYDHLATRNRLTASRGIDLRTAREGLPLKSDYTAGFTYSDCWVEDSRLVVLNALDAKERGAVIRSRCRFLGARRIEGFWQADLLGEAGGAQTVLARALVNAAGPWVQATLAATGSNARPHLRLIKGSHIVVPKLYEGAQAYILQNSDGRVVFVIPYEGKFSLVGTTDVAFAGDPSQVAITPDETIYLCNAVARVFAAPPGPDDVVWSYAGVRPLYDDDSDDPSAVTRDYVLELDAPEGQPTLLSVFGGKITTFRRLAEHALEKLAPHLGITASPWTARAPLPGGDMPNGDFSRFVGTLKQGYPWLDKAILHRLARAYGTRVHVILEGAMRFEDLGQHLGCGLTEREIRYLIDHEFASVCDDILWRRSKLGLHGGAELSANLDTWMGARNRREG